MPELPDVRSAQGKSPEEKQQEVLLLLQHFHCFITDHYGPRCSDFKGGCRICAMWAVYDLVDAMIWLSAKAHHLPIAGSRPSGTREDLRSLNDLFETVARVLGASQVPLEPDARRRQVLDILTSGRFPKGTLIIIDNYETLQPEEQERIVAFLFEELPYPSQALITSRHEEHLLVIQTHILPIKVLLDRMSHEDAAICLDYFLSLQSPPTVTSASIKQEIIALSDRIPLAMLWLLGQLRYSPRSPRETLDDVRQRSDGANAGSGKSAPGVVPLPERPQDW